MHGYVGKFLVKPIPKASSGLWELEYICFTDALLVPLHHVAHGIGPILSQKDPAGKT